jgi:hypothetical protein
VVPDALIELSPRSHVRVLARPVADIERYPQVTRTGPAGDVVEDGPLDGVRDRPGATASLWDLVEAGPAGLVPPGSVAVLGACIGAVAAGASGARVALPIDPHSDLGTTSWPIS